MGAIALPSGIRLNAPDDAALNRKYVAHARASLAEGLCPHHGTALSGETAAPAGIPAGYCRACACWWWCDPRPSGFHEVGQAFTWDEWGRVLAHLGDPFGE